MKNKAIWWACFSALCLSIVVGNLCYQTYLKHEVAQANIAAANAMKEQGLQNQADGARMLFMIRIGMLDWMRVCAYVSGQRLYSREAMEKRCSVDLDVKGAGK